MKRYYRGFIIEGKIDYYQITSEADQKDTWTADTIEEAKEDIDFRLNPIWKNFK